MGRANSPWHGMTRIGTGGCAAIYADARIAYKVLRSNASTEQTERFKREIEVLQEVRALRIPNVVLINEHGTFGKELWYSMPRYSGNLDNVVTTFSRSPRKLAAALLPVVKALRDLAESSSQIFHRDLKPENILIAKTDEEEPKLIVADFGCAYLKKDEEERHTAQNRAVGGWQYRAPEAQFGKIEDVSGAADIYSLGKLLWYMFNGEEGTVFPYGFWYPPQFNLSLRSPGTETDRLNLVIAGCVRFDSSKRLSYRGLVQGLEDLVASESTSGEPSYVKMQLAIKKKEEETDITLQEDQERFMLLLNAFRSDYVAIVNDLREQHRGTRTADALVSLLSLNCNLEDVAKNTIRLQSPTSICNAVLEGGTIFAVSRPASGDGTPTAVIITFVVNKPSERFAACICTDDADGTQLRVDGTSRPYGSQELRDLFDKFLTMVSH